MRWLDRLAMGALVLAAFACGDRDAKLRDEFRMASIALVDQRVPGAKNCIRARDGWILHESELEYVNAGSFIGENATAANPNAPPEYADPIPAIVDFHRQLEARGIELYLLPVPVRPIIFPESVLGTEAFADREVVPNLQLSLQEAVSVLQERGVRVIDLTERFLKHREDPQRGPVFLPSETHWTPYGISLAAKRVAARIKERPWYESVFKHDFSQRWLTKMHKSLISRRCEQASGLERPRDPVQVRRVRLKTENGRMRIGLENPESPVIVMGDSNTNFWNRRDSSLPQILGFELGFPVDLISIAGGGANDARLNLMRRIRAEPEYLEDKRAIIWCFSARAFTNTPGGWRLLPID